MTIQQLLLDIKNNQLKFADIIAYIDAHYQHTATAFHNGAQYNQSHENQGSAKIFSFAKLNQFNKEQTLSLFVEHYANVLAHPNQTDHQNIREFIKNGWDGIAFEGQALTQK